MTYKTRFFALFAIMSMFNLAASFAHPVTPTVIQELHLHDYMFGVALGVMMITNFLLSPFWGKINQYIPARVELIICCTGYSIAQLGFAFATTELGIIGARMFAGLFTGGVFVAVLAYVVNMSKPEDQAKYLTITATIQTVGSAFGYMVGGFLGEISVRTAFFAQSATLMLAGILFYLLLEPDNKHDLSEISRQQLIRESNPFQAFLDCGKFMTLTFVMLFAINILINFGNTSFDQAFNYYLKDQLSLTSKYNGIIKACVGLISFVANMTLCVWIINKTNVRRSMVALTLVSTAAAVGNIISPNIMIFIVFAVLVYACYSVSVPVIQHMIAAESDPEQKGLVMGFYNATKSLGSMFASLSVGFIYSVNVRLPFVVTAAVYGLAILAAFTALRMSGKKAA